MAEETKKRSIFNTDSADRAESPEKINEYIRVGNPGYFIMILAMVVVVAAILIWGLTGTLPVTETVPGVVDASNNNHVSCFVDASSFSAEGLLGNKVSIRMSDRKVVSGKVEDVRDVPVSEEEAYEMIQNDWLSSNLITSNYSYIVSIIPDEDLSFYSYEITDVSIITENLRPVELLIR